MNPINKNKKNEDSLCSPKEIIFCSSVVGYVVVRVALSAIAGAFAGLMITSIVPIGGAILGLSVITLIGEVTLAVKSKDKIFKILGIVGAVISYVTIILAALALAGVVPMLAPVGCILAVDLLLAAAGVGARFFETCKDCCA